MKELQSVFRKAASAGESELELQEYYFKVNKILQNVKCLTSALRVVQSSGANSTLFLMVVL